ncbi:hypothetical protein NLU13_3250 [Sarocladium strictum]|nr:hypothetical protein NLU13_3250 [Sarocladium strictum]
MLYLLTASAPAIRTIAFRRESFPKWTETYEVLRLFGENVLTCEGATWRMHRKATAASFNEKNAGLVFYESIRQAKGLLELWTAEGEKGTVIENLEKDTMRLTLNIIGYVGFGMRMLWPGQTLAEGADFAAAKYGSLEAPEGHTLSFVDTMEQVLEHIFLLLIFPAGLLHRMPFRATKEAAIAHDDYKKYMTELLNEKETEARKGSRSGEEGMDLMGQLIRSMHEAEDPSSKNHGVSLTRDDIIGNAFIMLVAGHETSANAIHFTLIEMATNPAAQRRLQRDLDDLVGKSDPETWDYEAMVGPLMGSMVGAAMNETLRLIPPAAEIPKVAQHRDEPLVVNGKEYTIPKGTVISLVVVAAQRNPNHWPSQPSKLRPGRDDLWDYEPERWLIRNDSKGSTPEAEGNVTNEEDFGGYRGPDTSAQLFRPERGAYVPFSDGPRSCLGRRIAQVEILAALAVLFRDHSVELVVDEADGEDDESRYRAAQERSRQTVEAATSVITLKLHGNLKVPIRLVKRGEEKFARWIDR